MKTRFNRFFIFPFEVMINLIWIIRMYDNKIIVKMETIIKDIVKLTGRKKITMIEINPINITYLAILRLIIFENSSILMKNRKVIEENKIEINPIL